MPFKSEDHRRYMWANHPEIARRWAEKYGSTPQPSARDRESLKGLKKASRSRAHRNGV